MLNVQIARADWKAEKTEQRGKSESWTETSKENGERIRQGESRVQSSASRPRLRDDWTLVFLCPSVRRGRRTITRGARMLPKRRKPRQLAPPGFSSCRLFREARALGERLDPL
jgi:hypothetical protein